MNVFPLPLFIHLQHGKHLVLVERLDGGAVQPDGHLGQGRGGVAHRQHVAALDAIGRRSTSLASFVTGYRSLASVPEPRPERIRVHDLFMRLQAMVGGAWAKSGGEARFTVEPANLELVADPGHLEQALMNLVNNALEATAGLARPQLDMSARLVRGGQLRIEVADNGPGVPDELIRQIFTPFFTTRAHGSGIGLAMVRQLVHRNGGRVRYARALAGGARFVMTF